MNLSLVFLIAACVCFVVALLVATATIASGNFDAWLVGGLLSFALSFVPWRAAP